MKTMILTLTSAESVQPLQLLETGPLSFTCV